MKLVRKFSDFFFWELFSPKIIVHYRWCPSWRTVGNRRSHSFVRMKCKLVCVYFWYMCLSCLFIAYKYSVVVSLLWSVLGFSIQKNVHDLLIFCRNWKLCAVAHCIRFSNMCWWFLNHYFFFVKLISIAPVNLNISL